MICFFSGFSDILVRKNGTAGNWASTHWYCMYGQLDREETSRKTTPHWASLCSHLPAFRASFKNRKCWMMWFHQCFHQRKIWYVHLLGVTFALCEPHHHNEKCRAQVLSCAGNARRRASKRLQPNHAAHAKNYTPNFTQGCFMMLGMGCKTIRVVYNTEIYKH